MRSRPAAASGGPPRTGASIRVTSRGSLLATERIASGPTVEISISRCPGVSAPTTPLSANSTCCSASGVASMVMTASAPVTAPAGDEAAAAPWSINGAVLLLVRFQTVTSWPASSSRVAIGLPISPRPRKASLLIECSVLGVTCRGLQRRYGHAVVAMTTSSRGTSSRPRASPYTPCLSSRLAWIHAAGEPESLDPHQQGFLLTDEGSRRGRAELLRSTACSCLSGSAASIRSPGSGAGGGLAVTSQRRCKRADAGFHSWAGQYSSRRSLDHEEAAGWWR